MHSVKIGEKTIHPTKILCVGRNYLEHIKELNNAIPDEMVIFNKPSSSISSQLMAHHGETLHYEGEICFIVRNGQYSAVGLGLDLTKRGLQSKLKDKGLPWERAKAFDGSAVFSRFIPLNGIAIESLELELFINCVRVQKGAVTQMLYPPQTILEELKTYTTLCDGDIIMTGTPQGVGEVHLGDVFLGRLIANGKTLIEIEWVAQ
ncbi:fumarylacetoacetate hydrolase family protein [Vibrio sp. Isolate25]|uniref:fumarylacetoacetate hydrolase family protein n=1 Tax=unclassified Vibrio TaxID=2614977 RepID=UPI001EFCF953|nr:MULTISPECIES: fumarylacetoacetate hydrolase family protein [unclassified Vibrio]MCG9595426.1 fumarylacetoacetate hydrolase family protein [Vibrio sp. Isolate25]MCG9676918.1 fumarylacetoacetate hydrolase family protein [Vibrio sp. Isolate24]MCG9681325.1 fumarylacetoacetate hydrolase family protein [Vibrio sp. Isolate23]USD34413.1 fumarylacetoacetate hydrolase family protein [Vibrio sp. SCSIO 43186]USD47484.1 fumarylacetoacetate hydrolase family protein [Vibrio sp. SCSIO 43145]